MSTEENEFADLEGMLGGFRPARPSADMEEVIGLRLNEELELAFLEALKGIGLKSPSAGLEAALERDLAWEFRLEDRLRGLPLRRPTVALGRAVEVQVNLRALRRDEVVVPFPIAPTDPFVEGARRVNGGWMLRWGVAAALVLGGFGMGWKMARDAAQELRGGVIAGRFESEAARATAQLAVSGAWEPVGVPLPMGVADVGYGHGIEREGVSSRSVGAVGGGPTAVSRGSSLGRAGGAGGGERGESGVDGAGTGRGEPRGAVVGRDEVAGGVGVGGGVGASGAAVADMEARDPVTGMVLNGRLVGKLAQSGTGAAGGPVAAPAAGAGAVVAGASASVSGGEGGRTASSLAAVPRGVVGAVGAGSSASTGRLASSSLRGAAPVMTTAAPVAAVMDAGGGDRVGPALLSSRVAAVPSVGSGALTVGSGALALNGTSSFGGGTSVAGGAVVVSSAAVSGGGVGEAAGARTMGAERGGSRILDAVSGGEMASVIPVEILHAVESGVGAREMRRMVDVDLPVKASFSDADLDRSAVGASSISVRDLVGEKEGVGRVDGDDDGARLRTRDAIEEREGERREGQLVYVADDDALKLEIGKGPSGGLVARFERLDGHFLAADEVRSAVDLEVLAGRARRVLNYLPVLDGEGYGPALPASLLALPMVAPKK